MKRYKCPNCAREREVKDEIVCPAPCLCGGIMEECSYNNRKEKKEDK